MIYKIIKNNRFRPGNIINSYLIMCKHYNFSLCISQKIIIFKFLMTYSYNYIFTFQRFLEILPISQFLITFSFNVKYIRNNYRLFLLPVNNIFCNRNSKSAFLCSLYDQKMLFFLKKIIQTFLQFWWAYRRIPLLFIFAFHNMKISAIYGSSGSLISNGSPINFSTVSLYSSTNFDSFVLLR